MSRSGRRTPRSTPRPSRVARRLVAVVAIVGAALMLLFYGAGGWYFSGAIKADGLMVVSDVAEYDHEVVAAETGSITVTHPDDAETVLDGNNVWGVRWARLTSASESGYGQLSGNGTGTADVTRDFRVLAGQAPRPGDVAELDRSAFPDDPEVALGLPVQEVTYGKAELAAWYVPGVATTWAILVHGKGEDRTEMLRMMQSTVGHGLPSLAITYRNDIGAQADDSGRYQFGRTEWADLDAAVRYAQERGADQLVLVGASMGGAIIASYLQHVPEAPVSALVLDSPMLDFAATVSHGASQRSLPLIGHVPESLTWTAKRIATLRYDLDWSEYEYLTDTSWLHVPTLVIHGTNDKTVPLSLSRQLAQARPDHVELVVVPAAGHVASWNTDPDAYDAKLTRFLESVPTT
jgi:uncharacterized protein